MNWLPRRYVLLGAVWPFISTAVLPALLVFAVWAVVRVVGSN